MREELSEKFWPSVATRDQLDVVDVEVVVEVDVVVDATSQDFTTPKAGSLPNVAFEQLCVPDNVR